MLEKTVSMELKGVRKGGKKKITEKLQEICFLKSPSDIIPL